jgi:hypothetical protein
MTHMAMRQHTFISFLCCPEGRGLSTEEEQLMIETCRSDF